MKDVIKGYRQMFAGWFGFIVLLPGLIITATGIILFVKLIYKLILWLW